MAVLYSGKKIRRPSDTRGPATDRQQAGYGTSDRALARCIDQDDAMGWKLYFAQLLKTLITTAFTF